MTLYVCIHPGRGRLRCNKSLKYRCLRIVNVYLPLMMNPGWKPKAYGMAPSHTTQNKAEEERNLQAVHAPNLSRHFSCVTKH